MKLVIASSNSILLHGLKHLDELGPFKVVDMAQRARDTLELVARHLPDVLVVEDQLVTIDAALLSDCRSACPGLKIVLVEGLCEPASEGVFLKADYYARPHCSLAELARVVESLGSEG